MADLFPGHNPSPTFLEIVAGDLLRDEGLKLKPYRCSQGALTIGIGRNLDAKGITRGEAERMLRNDIDEALEECQKNIAGWYDLARPAQRALINMCFQLGWPRLSGFKRMFAAISAGDWLNAAHEAMDSRWAEQTPVRAEHARDLLLACALHKGD